MKPEPTFFAPWDTSIRTMAAICEKHCALCRAAGLPYTTPLFAAPQGYVDEPILDLFGWHPKGYDPTVADPLAQLLNPAWEHLGLWGGRGSGKSHRAAEEIIEVASIQKERVAGAREYMSRIKESSKELLENKISESRFRDDWDVLDTELRNRATGSVIFFVGLAGHNAESVGKSLEGITLLWTDEAQLLTKRSIDILLPTIRAAGSRCLWTWNPGQEPTPIDELLRGDQLPERALVKCLLVEDNPYLYCTRLASELRSSFLREKTEQFRYVWRGAHLEVTDTAIFDDIQQGYLEFGALLDGGASALQMAGFDFGYGGEDPSACVKSYLIPPEAQPGFSEKTKPLLFVAGEGVQAKLPNHRLHELAREAATSFAYYDSANPLMGQALQDGGINAHPAYKGPGSVMEGLSVLQSVAILVSPRCPVTWAELKGLRWATEARTGKIIKPLRPVGDDHCIDCLRYGLSGSNVTPTKGGTIKWEKVS